MRGEDRTQGPQREFVFSKGDNWIAAGIQFQSFGFIEGKLVVAVEFGREFVFHLLGLAAFSIKPLAYIEIGIEIEVDSEGFLLKAGISPNSYLIHPDIFSLQGDIGLYVFSGGAHAGDFLLSIGGYHPLYSKPEHYPELNRVAVKAQLGIVRFSIECFFAATPQALMAGAKASLSAEFAGIGCGMDIYFDVLIVWDPFFIRGRLGVALWFEFFGRHEISVELDIWTPDFGGVATVDLALVSFEVDFGEELDKPPPPPLHEFLTERLVVPATPWNNDGAKVVTFNTSDRAGLLRIDFLHGRNSKDEQPKTSAQEGITREASGSCPRIRLRGANATADRRIRRNHRKLSTTASLSYRRGQSSAVQGFNLASTIKVNAIQLSNGANTTGRARRVRLVDSFPSATFGAEASSWLSPNNRSKIANVDSTKARIPLTDGIEFHYDARLPRDETIVLSARERGTPAAG